MRLKSESKEGGPSSKAPVEGTKRLQAGRKGQTREGAAPCGTWGRKDVTAAHTPCRGRCVLQRGKDKLDEKIAYRDIQQ